MKNDIFLSKTEVEKVNFLLNLRAETASSIVSLNVTRLSVEDALKSLTMKHNETEEAFRNLANNVALSAGIDTSKSEGWVLDPVGMRLTRAGENEDDSSS